MTTTTDSTAVTTTITITTTTTTTTAAAAAAAAVAAAAAATLHCYHLSGYANVTMNTTTDSTAVTTTHQMTLFHRMPGQSCSNCIQLPSLQRRLACMSYIRVSAGIED